MSKVSVIIPNFNCAKWLPDVVANCLKQKFLQEIIIVDDQSSDNSWEVLSDIQNNNRDKVKIFKNSIKGGNNARNFGFEQSTGEYIQWLDADDYLLEDKFENQLKTFDEYPQVDIVYSDWYMDYYNSELKIVKREEKIQSAYDDFTFEILKDNWSANNNYLFKRNLVEKLYNIRAWNPGTKVAQDREYLTLAVLLGAKAAYCSGFYCVYNIWSKNSVSAMDFKIRLQHQLVLEKKFHDIILNSDYKNRMKKRYLSVLNAHTMNACFYNPKLTIRYLFSIFNIRWEIIHWKKWPFIPIIYIWQHLKYSLIKMKPLQ